MSRCKLRNARPKALLGLGAPEAGIIAGATLAAAGITGGITTKAAKDQVKATQTAAKQQAESIEQQTELQTRAIAQSNEVDRELKDKELSLLQEQHRDEQQGQKDLQMAVLALSDNENDILAKQEYNNILKCGGRIKLRDAGGIQITDGGYALPLRYTPDGMLYELRGDNHEQSHKVGNTRKTGVGVKIGNRVVEGEGNGNSPTGELVLTRPDGAIFLSKHSINGFNPRNAVLAGMDPLDVYVMQESMKSERNKHYNNRSRAIDGGYWENYGGSTITGIGNLVGAGLGSMFGFLAGRKLGRAQKRAAGLLNDAYLTAGNQLADAYDKLTGMNIDDVVRYDDYRATGYVPSLRTPHYVISNKVNAVNRGVDTLSDAVNASNMSGVARLNRLRDIRLRGNEQLSAAYAEQANKENEIHNQNIEARNQAAATNAYLQSRARQQFADARFNVAKYNADIANQRILGAANARANALTQGTSALASGIVGNAQARSEALSNAGTLFGNAVSSTGLTFGSRMNEIRDRDWTIRLAELLRNNGDVSLGLRRGLIRGNNSFDRINQENYLLGRALGERYFG